MLRYQKFKKTLSLVMSVFMVMGCFSPSMLSKNKVYASQNEEFFTHTKIDLDMLAMNKIEPQVIQDFENDELVEVMIYMTSQVDTEMVAYESQKSLSASMTPYQTKLQVRRNVVEALRDNAKTSQLKVVNYLNNEKEKGNVEDFQSYSIVNMLYIKATKEVVENLARMPEVEKIYKNQTYTLDVIEDVIETDFEIKPTGDNVEWNVSQVRADEVWELGYDGTGVVVGVMDSGVDWTHPALKNKWRGYNPATGETTPEGNWFDPVYNSKLPGFSSGHGTHVTGTILGQEPDGSNKIGIAPGAKWIAVKLFSKQGSTTDAILLSAADWIINPDGNPDNAPDIVNNSWGGQNGLNDFYREAVRAWRAAGIVPIFSAGNRLPGEPEPWPGSISVPSNYPESIAVAALDINNNLAPFSKLGPSPYDETMIKPNVGAGGVNVRSSVPDGEYALNSGTSMSAPAVSGVVALLLSANASLSVDEIQEILEKTALPLTDKKYPEAPNMGYGYGLVDAFNAVSSVASGIGLISGRVIVQGEDTAEATIEHEQKIFETYIGSNIEILAQITDDASITEAELLVKQQGKSYWMVAPMTRVSGDHRDGMYKGLISADMIEGDQITYKIKARDYAGDVVVSKDYNILIGFGIIPGDYVQGFEEDLNGWILKGAWEHGVPANVGPKAFEGKKVVATTIDGNYPNNTNSWLISPPIDLRDASLETASLRFYEWSDIVAFDYGNLLVSDDFGSTWITVRPQITGKKAEWKETMVNLSDYIGRENPVFVAFNFTSNASAQAAGWYIDNVRIIGKDNEAPEIPTGLKINSGIKGIEINWNASKELDFSHYNIYRSETAEDGFELISQTKSNMFVNDDVVSETRYFYKINEEDLSGNKSEFTEVVSAIALRFNIVFGANFEGNNGGFIAAGTNNSWEWGIPTSGPMIARSGERLWATSLSANYLINSDCHITSFPISIPEDGTTNLVFNHWVDMESIPDVYDYGQVQISTDDGETWDNITPVSGGKYSGVVKAWNEEEISLEAYAGETIQIRFFFHSDNIVSYTGWYIDDVYVINIESEELLQESEKLEVSEELEITINKEYAEPLSTNYIISTKVKGYKTIEDSEIQSIPMVFAGIPAGDAVVTIKETGKSIKVDPTTGKFSIIVPAGTYTLIAEAYGCHSMEQTVVMEDSNVKANFILEPKSRGNIAGQTFNRYDGTAIAYAIVSIVEDPSVAPVIADENGNFLINNVYEGKYTLKVVADGFVLGKELVTVVGNESINVSIGLKPFLGFEDEIAYDYGKYGQPIVLAEAGDGLAVRFTPARYGKVKGANIYFYDSSWPEPGGNRIGFVIYGLNSKDEIYQVGEPIFQDIVRGKWNLIDLSSFKFETDKDFYISTIQYEAGKLNPAGCLDIASEHVDRSYFNVSGELIPISSEGYDGGFMIRARIEYDLDVPNITNLPELSYTNQDEITVEGTLVADAIVNVYVNGEKVTSVESIDKVFTAQIYLAEEENIIRITAELNGLETESSAPVVVIKDIIAPELTIISPVDNSKLNVELIDVMGFVSDNIGLSKLEINNKKIEISEDGSFNELFMLNTGINMIIIKATDLAGNVTTIERIVIAELDTPIITNILPDENITLRQEEALTVRFNALTGGKGYFRIMMPFGLQDNDLGIPMTEVDGLYTGIWTVPEGLVATGLQVQVIYINEFGTKLSKIADGKVTIIGNIENLAPNTVIIGNESYNIEYLNNSAVAQAKLIEWISIGGTIYIKINDTDIVTSEGQEVTIEVLPNFLTYFDANGEMTYYER